MDVRRTTPPAPTGLDAIDARLLTELFADARLSNAELGRRVGLSAPSVAERVRRLEERGVIAGRGIRIDASKLGCALSVMIRVRPLPGRTDDVVATLAGTPEIVRCDRVSGDDCFVAVAHVRDVEHMEAVIDRILPCAATHSAIVQSAPFEPRLPRLL